MSNYWKSSRPCLGFSNRIFCILITDQFWI